MTSDRHGQAAQALAYLRSIGGAWSSILVGGTLGVCCPPESSAAFCLAVVCATIYLAVFGPNPGRTITAGTGLAIGIALAGYGAVAGILLGCIRLYAHVRENRRNNHPRPSPDDAPARSDRRGSLEGEQVTP